MDQIKYEKLELEVIRFVAEDVITESPNYGIPKTDNQLPVAGEDGES